jgi:hypothetical protein
MSQDLEYYKKLSLTNQQRNAKKPAANPAQPNGPTPAKSVQATPTPMRK